MRISLERGYERTQCWFPRDVAAKPFGIVCFAEEPGLGAGKPVRTATRWRLPPQRDGTKLDFASAQTDIGQRAVVELLLRTDAATQLRPNAQIACQPDASENKSPEPSREFTHSAPQQRVDDQAALAALTELQFIS